MTKKILFSLLALLAVQAVAGNKLNLMDSLTSLRHIERERILEFTLTPEGVEEVLLMKDGDRLYWRHALNLMWPVSVNGRSSKVLESALARMLGDETISLDQLLKQFDEAVPNFELKPSQIKQIKSIGTLPDIISSLISYDVCSLSMVDADGSLYVFRVGNSSYGSGAFHGMYGCNYVNYFAPSDKVLELSDLVRVADHDALSRVVTQALMNKECVTTVEQLCTDKGYFIDDLVPLSDVFYCSDHCLHFVYQPYEIACFAAGIIDIEVWDYLLEDAGLLTPLGKRVLTK